MEVLDRIGGRLEAIAAEIPACIAKASEDAKAIAEAQLEVDRVLRMITNCASAHDAWKRPPFEFLAKAPGQSDKHLAAATEHFMRDWKKHCKEVEREPTRWAHETWQCSTVADYIDYFTALEAAGQEIPCLNT